MTVAYRLEIADRHAHLFRVTLTLPAPAREQRLRLPVWVPGSYLVREMARHLSALHASQGGRAVPLVQQDKSSWVARTSGRAALRLSWLAYAFDPSVRGAFLDAGRGFFNGSSLFLSADGREHEPHTLQIGPLPAGWDLATAMPSAPGRRRFIAADHAELIDHPFELGQFWRGEFRAGGVPHEIVVTGAWPNFDGQRLLVDCTRLCAAQIRLWHGRGRPPFDRFVFLLNATADGGGGLEHRASTALAAARGDLPRPGLASDSSACLRLLGLVSHEYFHAWNGKRLRVRDLAAPDLGREAPTGLLWFVEGLTSYYDDLMLRRAGLVDLANYLDLLAAPLNTVAATPGRQVHSVAQAGFDAWTKFYRPDENTPNATVSYYAKGALVALCLDLTLRLHGDRSLDDVLRQLWRLNRPIGEDDIAAALAAAAGRSLDAELQAWVHGTDELPLVPLLAQFGVATPAGEAGLASGLGLRLHEGPVTGVRVRSVLRGSAAEAAGISAGDELLAADGWRLRRLDDASAWLRPGAAFELLLVRGERVLSLHVQPVAAVGPNSLRPDPGASPAALARRQAWLAA